MVRRFTYLLLDHEERKAAQSSSHKSASRSGMWTWAMRSRRHHAELSLNSGQWCSVLGSLFCHFLCAWKELVHSEYCLCAFNLSPGSSLKTPGRTCCGQRFSHDPLLLSRNVVLFTWSSESLHLHHKTLPLPHFHSPNCSPCLRAKMGKERRSVTWCHRVPKWNSPPSCSAGKCILMTSVSPRE
jgi:hypothetical protein